MYIRIDLLNPCSIEFSESFPNSSDAIVLRIEDNQVWRCNSGDWQLVYESKSTITTFYRMCELVTTVMAMHSENLLREHCGQAQAYTEQAFSEIIDEMQILMGSRQ
jgi:hypothetical protein